MILPHNKESEIQVIGSLIIGSDEETEGIYGLLVEDDFYDSRHKMLFSACRSMHEKMQTIDIVSLSNVVGPEINSMEISEFTYRVLSTSNSMFHAATVKDYSDKRKLVKMATKTIEYAEDATKTAEEIITENDMALFSISSGKSESNLYTLPVLAGRGVERIAKAMQNGSRITGIPCGFNSIDGLTAGFQRQNMIILAARPSMGKTAMALNFAMNMASNNHPVGFFSLEMSADELWQRLISTREKISSGNLMSGEITEKEYRSIINSSINNLPVYIDESSGISVSSIRSKARIMVRKQKVEMIFVDYIGLVSADGKNHGNRNNEIGYISAQLKGIAKELNIPVMVLCQMSRESTKLQIRPRLIDLRESGNIEQDADIVIFIHRPEQVGVDTISNGDSSAGMAEIYFEKFRNGKTGMIMMRWHGEYGQFSCIESYIKEPPANSRAYYDNFN